MNRALINSFTALTIILTGSYLSPSLASTLISGIYPEASKDYQEHLLRTENSLLRQSTSFSGPYSFLDRGFGLALYTDGIQNPILRRSDQKFSHINNLDSFIPDEKAISFLAYMNSNTTLNTGSTKEQLAKDDKAHLVNNISPLTFKSWSFANTGFINNFDKIRFELDELVSEEVKRVLLANDDSALDSRYLFGIIMTNMHNTSDPSDKEIKQSVENAFEEIYKLSPKSQITFMMTSGKKIIAARTNNELALSKTHLLYYYDKSESNPKLLFSTQPTTDAFEFWHYADGSSLLVGSLEERSRGRNLERSIRVKEMNLRMPKFLTPLKSKPNGKSVFSRILNRG